jgi:hypothetical protein
MSWWRHAFAIEKAASLEPTPRQKEIADRVCREICRRRMQTAAGLFLEMARPMNYMGAQFLHFFEPIVGLLTDAEGYREFSLFLEHRGSIDYMCRRLEEIDSGADNSPNSSEAGSNGIDARAQSSSMRGDGTDES